MRPGSTQYLLEVSTGASRAFKCRVRGPQQAHSHALFIHCPQKQDSPRPFLVEPRAAYIRSRVGFNLLAGGPSWGAPSIPLDRKLSTWSRALILAIIHGRKPETSCLFATAAHPKKSSKGGSSWPTSGAQSVGSSCLVYARRTKKRSCAAFSAEVSRQRDQVRPWPGGAPSGSASGPPRRCPPRIQGDTQCFRPTRLGEDLPRWRLDALPRLEAGGLARAAAS